MSLFRSVFIKGSKPCVSASSKNCAAVLFLFAIINKVKARRNSVPKAQVTTETYRARRDRIVYM